jgi:type I restriction enzyme S subunit
MQSIDYWDQIAVGAVKSTIENFSAGRYRALAVPLPSLEEQRAIADYLDHETAQIDALVAKQKEFIGLLRERRSGLLFRAVTRGLDPDVPLQSSTLSWTTELPASWRVMNIRRVAAMKTGHTPSRSTPEYWEDTTIPGSLWQMCGSFETEREPISVKPTA